MNNNTTIKKILVFNHDAVLYGASRSLLDMLSVLIQVPGLRLLVLLPEEGALTDRLTKSGIPYRVCHYPRNVSFYHKPVSGLKSFYRKFRQYLSVLRSLKKQVKDYNPDLIYTNTSVIYWGAILGIITGTKHCWHMRELNDAYSMQRDFGLFFLKLLLGRAGTIVCNSRAVLENYQLQENSKACVVYNGVVSAGEATALFAARKKNMGNPVVIGMAGAIHPSKGQLQVVEALATLYVRTGSDFRLHIAGNSIDDSYTNAILNLIQENNLQEKVIMAGFTLDMDVFYAGIDVLVCGSLSEAFGRVVPEAMVRGIVVIARNTGGIPEIIDHEKNGFLFNNVNELQQCIRGMLNETFDLEKMRLIAFETVIKRFTRERFAKEMTGLLFH